MDQKILEFVALHPVLAIIIIVIIQSVLLSFVVELFKYIVVGEKQYILDSVQQKSKDKLDSVIYRLATVGIAVGLAILELYALNGTIQSISLKILFVVLQTSVPFAFYHLKGKQLIEVTINKLFSKFKKTNI